MDKAAILARLREHEPALRERGVSHAAVFGSRARGDNRPDSDIDILVEIGPMSLWGYVGLTQFIEGLFPEPVDVADRSRLKPFLRPTAEREAIYAFWQRFQAATLAFEIISEAARRFALSVRERQPELAGARSWVSETFCATITMM